jgi:hypothetical protein
VRGRLVRILAWIVTGGLLFLLFRRIPIGEVIAAARGAAGWETPVCLVLVAAVYVCDAFAMWKTFGWFVAPMAFGDVLLVRGATYLFAALNYNVGQGAIVYFVHKTTGAPVMRAVATVLLMMGINVLALLFLSSVGLAAAPDVPHAVTVTVAVAYAGLALYVVALVLRPGWLVRRPLFDVVLGAGIGGHLRALVVRVPHIAALIVFQLALLRGFHVAVPVVAALAALPIVFLAAALPVSVQGLGTTQAAMIYFFARYAPGDRPAQQATVMAASLVGQALALGLQALIGVVCLRSRVGRGLGQNSVTDPG